MREVKPAPDTQDMRVPRRERARKAPRPNFLRRGLDAVSSLFSLRHPTFFLGFILSCFAVVFLLLASGIVGRTVRRVEIAVDWALADAGFAITAVEVNGAVHVPRADILVQLDAGRSIFTVSPLESRLRILQLDWVKTADVRRRYPGEIAVTLTERKPFALWQQHEGGPVAMVEKGGARITDRGLDKFRALPLLIGEGAPGAAVPFLEAMRRHPVLAQRVKAYRYYAQRRWDLILSDGVVVKLPEYLWERQLDEFERLIVKQNILQYSVGEIDLRNDTHLIFGKVPNVKPEDKKPGGGNEI